MGVFVIASQDQSRPSVDRPFTDMEVPAAGGHGAVSPGGDITYTITVRNRGPKAAGEVTLHAELSPDSDFISASPSRGTCHKSELSDGTVLCSLAAIPEGTGVNVTLVARVRRNEFLDKAERKIPFLVFLRFKERPADMQSYVNMVESRIDTTIAPQRKITHHR